MVSSNDGNRVDDGSAILGTSGNDALSRCSVVEREDDEEDEFPDAGPEDVDPEDESGSKGDSTLEDKAEVFGLGIDAIARFATRFLRGLWAGAATIYSPIPK